MRDVGVVGEVAIDWVQGRPARVLVEADPPLWADGASTPTAGHRFGPLVASQARPIERLQLGGLAVPIAVNTYTGGVPDWPARALWAATGSPGAVVALHVALGAVLIGLVHRFLRFHGTRVAAGVAALALATDWSFLFYKKVLGGTEILLQACVLLCLWSVWSRRWSGGRHGLLALGVGIGLGLMAKAPFLLTVAALAATTLVTRWDRPKLRPPLPRGLWRPAAAIVLLTSPLWLTALHHGLAVPEQPHVVSHDFQGVQLQRVLSALGGERSPARESLSNLALWLGNPLGFFRAAYGAEAVSTWSPWRVAGWLLVVAGVAVGWRDRHPTPHVALLRFTSVFLVLQVSALWLVARDLHHLAQAAPTLAIVVGLSVDRLASVASPPRSPARARTALVLVVPWLWAGVSASMQTDGILASIRTPTFTREGQAAIVDLLRQGGVEQVVACDYELTGVLEALAPDIEAIHGWGAASQHRSRALPGLLRLASGHHFLVVEASAPMIYNLAPGERDLRKAADQAGVRVSEVGRLPSGAAVLYAVEPP